MIFHSQKLFADLAKYHFVIAGPCVLESYDLALTVAFQVKKAAECAKLFPVFKSSFDKANRTSNKSFRGPGLSKGLQWLADIREKTGLPILTDIHDGIEVQAVAEVADIIQIPAFLCRQTSLLEKVAQTDKVINIKKGQFLAPWDMQHVCSKITAFGNQMILLTERGTSFGYNNLVVDMRSFQVMNQLGFPTIIDATHSVQLPGGQGGCSGGDREFVAPIAKAGAAAGARGVFLECHPDPDRALCDGPNSLHLSDLKKLLLQLHYIWETEYVIDTALAGFSD